MRRLPSIHDQQGLSSPSGIEEVAAKYNVDSFSDRLRYLHVLLIADFDSPLDHLRAYLEAGCAFFRVSVLSSLQLMRVWRGMMLF